MSKANYILETIKPKTIRSDRSTGAQMADLVAADSNPAKEPMEWALVSQSNMFWAI